MRSYTRAMSTNRPAPSAQIAAIAATLALIVTTFVIALAAFAAGAYPRRSVEEPAPAATSQSAESSDDLIDPSIGRGSDSKVCTASPSSPRCHLEGGSGLYLTRGGHALRPATDGTEVLLDSEWDETGPADMPGRAPGRGGWVGEEGPSAA
uniref:Uncharacterized protein n=1 Tax=Phage sp. ct4bw6 TaxID=2826747 RepID=A0A8S5MV29_9VIRU|nr:MAG TPA: hypothetical protein [Phage sp. ct4bw6]